MSQFTCTALAIVIGLSVLAGATAEPLAASPLGTPEATPAAEDAYAHPEWLADAAWLRAHLGNPRVRVIALTPQEDFARGHIPGAVQIDWPALEIVETSDQSVAHWRGEVERQLTELGVQPDQTVVVYDGGTLYAARLWWILYQLGHADVRVLNGGLPAWIASGGPVETGPAHAPPAPHPYAGKPDESAIATLDEVKAALDDPDVVLVDARSPAEYAAGHIPGAINVEFTQNAEPGQPRYWKRASELRAMYAALGITPDKHVIPYCLTGVRSAATYFTLRLIGYDDVTLFTGSWKEWSSHQDLPVRTGSAP
ncbi:MAG: hypothetical protein C4346_16220 [Chloroflexota bacterium]